MFFELFLGLVISNSVIFLTALMTIWCSFDVAGRYWVRLKKYKKSEKNARSKRQISGSEFSIQPTHVKPGNETYGEDIPPLLQQSSAEVGKYYCDLYHSISTIKQCTY